MAVRKSSTWYQQASALVVFITVATGGLASFLGDVGGIRSAVTELFWPKPEAKVPTAEISVREVSRSALRTTRDQRAGREGTRYRISFEAIVSKVTEGEVRNCQAFWLTQRANYPAVWSGEEGARAFDLPADVRSRKIGAAFDVSLTGKNELQGPTRFRVECEGSISPAIDAVSMN